MEALVLASYGPPPFPLGVESRPVPKPGKGQVLIRVTASPVNPSDLHFLEGQYAFRKTLPSVPGLEGCGRVVAAGDGLLARRLPGNRVAFPPAPHAHPSSAQHPFPAPNQLFLLPT